MTEIAAFPIISWKSPDGMYATDVQRGMDLRDYIAVAALQSMGTWMPIEGKAPYYHTPDLKSDEAMNARARWAYRQADAMLKARPAPINDGEK